MTTDYLQRRHSLYKGKRIEGGTWVGVSRKKHSQWDELSIDGFLVYTPAQFDWGNLTPASTNLALAILMHYFGDNIVAAHLYHKFAHDVIAKIKTATWTLFPADIESWMAMTGIPGTERLAANRVGLKIKH